MNPFNPTDTQAELQLQFHDGVSGLLAFMATISFWKYMETKCTEVLPKVISAPLKAIEEAILKNHQIKNIILRSTKIILWGVFFCLLMAVNCLHA